MKIYKYKLMVTDYQKVEMPLPIKLLNVVMQGDALMLYALVDVTEAMVEVPIRIVGTGHDFSDYKDWKYLTTVSMQKGILMWHIFTKSDYEPGCGCGGCHETE